MGNRHTFTSQEIKTLNQKFKNITYINYNNTYSISIIKKLDSRITNTSDTKIILNTQARVPNELLSHLTNLELTGARYTSIKSFLEKYLNKCFIPKDQIDINFLADIQPYNYMQYFIKRLIDYGSVLTLGILTLPVMLYSIWRIKRESPGSVIFKQDRVGLNGREFTCYKFRSMSLDAEKHGAKFAKENDSRIFKWGHIMRKTRIDELPQLWNVLKGDMHLIGPRPERQLWIKQFEQEIPYYQERHIIRPGITGWAQINYPYGANAEDAQQKLMYDLYYIKYWTPWLEIKTAWKTIGVMLGEKGR